jgi:NADH-quinone oxidoreductase subunit C
MMSEDLKERLESVFKDVRTDTPGKNRIDIYGEKKYVSGILSFLKEQGFNHLTLLSCVDRIEENEFELVYILYAYPENNTHTEKEKTSVFLRTRLKRQEPRIPTIIPVFENAEPYEREIHELFGVVFEGHPRLTPLFLERKYETPPFRKEFDTREYVKKMFGTVPFVGDKK